MQMQPDSFNVPSDIKPVECMKQGWEMIKSEYWLFFGVTIVGLLIAGAIPLVLVGPMMCGIFFCFLKRYDGGKVEFGDIAKGFEFFVPSLISILILVGFFFVVAMVVIVLPTTISMFALLSPGSGGGKNPNPDNVIILVIVMCIEMFIFGVIAACSHALLIFTHLLIIDRKLSGWAAIKLSMKACWQNLNAVVGFILVQVAMMIVGYFCLIVGMYLVMPIAYAGTVVLYRKIFPALGPLPNYNAPSDPAAYPQAGFGQ
jgi:hypothetical protein